VTAHDRIIIHSIRFWPRDRVIDTRRGPGTVTGLVRDIGVWVRFDCGEERLMSPRSLRKLEVPS
jgi:hypothetical protein